LKQDRRPHDVVREGVAKETTGQPTPERHITVIQVQVWTFDLPAAYNNDEVGDEKDRKKTIRGTTESHVNARQHV
jgi:hypothetical protein